MDTVLSSDCGKMRIATNNPCLFCLLFPFFSVFSYLHTHHFSFLTAVQKRVLSKCGTQSGLYRLCAASLWRGADHVRDPSQVVRPGVQRSRTSSTQRGDGTGHPAGDGTNHVFCGFLCLTQWTLDRGG